MSGRRNRKRNKAEQQPRRQPAAIEPPTNEDLQSGGGEEKAQSAKLKRERRWSEGPAFAINVIILVVVVVECAANWYQYEAMREALVIDQRPYISVEQVQLSLGVKDVEAGVPIDAEVLFSNTGKSPADNVIPHRRMELIDYDPDGYSVRDVRRVFEDSRIPVLSRRHHGFGVAPGKNFAVMTKPPLVLTETQAAEFANGTKVIIVVAGARYRDVFGEVRETEYCGITSRERTDFACHLHNVMR